MTTLPAYLIERREQLVLGRREVDFLLADEDLALARSTRSSPSVNTGSCRARRRLGDVPKRDADPGEQLADAERLGQVVVGAGVERLDLVLVLAARRDHDDRRCASTRADARVTSRPSNRGGRGRAGSRRGSAPRPARARPLPVVALDQSVAVRRQRGAQEPQHLRLVLDDEDEGSGARHRGSPFRAFGDLGQLAGGWLALERKRRT